MGRTGNLNIAYCGLLTPWNRDLEKPNSTPLLVKKFSPFTELEGLLSYTIKSTTGPYAEPYESSSHFTILFS
jgi:hypothetical protein